MFDFWDYANNRYYKYVGSYPYHKFHCWEYVRIDGTYALVDRDCSLTFHQVDRLDGGHEWLSHRDPDIENGVGRWDNEIYVYNEGMWRESRRLPKEDVNIELMIHYKEMYPNAACFKYVTPEGSYYWTRDFIWTEPYDGPL